jgi:capsular exopolysaccharide synthesis family protein
MELGLYFRVLRRWWWLLLVAGVLGGGASYASTLTRPPRYQAASIVQVGDYLSRPGASAGAVYDAAAIAQQYIRLLRTRPITEGTANKIQAKLGQTLTVQQIEDAFQVRSIQGTSFIEITVIYSDPGLTIAIANELAEQLITNSPTKGTEEQQKQQLATLQKEIQSAEDQLKKDRDELKTVENSLKTVVGQELVILSDRRKELQSSINATQNNLAQMLDTVTKIQGQGIINTLRIVETATVATVVNAGVLNTVVFSVLACLGLALAASFGLEYLNDSVRQPSEVTNLLRVPLLGAILPFGDKRSYKHRLITWEQPRSNISEAFRALRVELQLRMNTMVINGDSKADKTLILMVTSANPSEGKSVTTANLAVSFAIAGQRTLLIDADLRRPSQHQVFNLANTVGFTTLWGAHVLESSGLDRARLIQPTTIPNLSVLTSGAIPEHPAEMLTSPIARDLFQSLRRSGEYDVVLIDTPPALVVADGTIVADASGAQIIMVIEAGRTRRGSAQRVLTQFGNLSLPVMGVILNRFKGRDAETGYGGYYTQYYYYGNQQVTPGNGKPPIPEKVSAK